MFCARYYIQIHIHAQEYYHITFNESQHVICGNFQINTLDTYKKNNSSYQ